MRTLVAMAGKVPRRGTQISTSFPHLIIATHHAMNAGSSHRIFSKAAKSHPLLNPPQASTFLLKALTSPLHQTHRFFWALSTHPISLKIQHLLQEALPGYPTRGSPTRFCTALLEFSLPSARWLPVFLLIYLFIYYLPPLISMQAPCEGSVCVIWS